MAENLDATDWAIRTELQSDGRVPGVMTGYRAEVDLGKDGYPVLAVVRLKYRSSEQE